MPGRASLLFIYGTLKRGDVRAPLLLGQQYLGKVKTAPRYRLYNVGDEYPALVQADTVQLPGRSIVGELWRVDDVCLARLDEEEGVNEGLYERRAVELANGAEAAQSYFYLPSVLGLKDCGTAW